ncbi:MAG: His/Gly/Thr/Pro-type tRNA ligase C-terminal domain-containing protein, partial [Nitrospiria bacterium]
LGDAAGRRLAPLLTELRDAGIRVETDYDRGSLKSQMRKADKLGARYTLILGDDELAKGVAPLRDMATKAQIDLALDRLVPHLRTVFDPGLS